MIVPTFDTVGRSWISTLEMRARRLLMALNLLFAACGSEVLNRPADLEFTEYPAGEFFTLTLVMSYCSSSCETYEDAECEVSVNVDERRIEVSPEVRVERADGACTESCSGAPVLVHCEVEPLASGEWTVEASEGTFSRVITLL